MQTTGGTATELKTRIQLSTPAPGSSTREARRRENAKLAPSPTTEPRRGLRQPRLGPTTHKGDYDRAIADFDRAIQLKPDDAVAYANRGWAYDDKGDYDRAIADFDRAIQLKPDYADAYAGRGWAYAKGDYDRAIADYDRAIQLKPDYGLGLRQPRLGLQRQGRL